MATKDEKNNPIYLNELEVTAERRPRRKIQFPIEEVKYDEQVAPLPDDELKRLRNRATTAVRSAQMSRVPYKTPEKLEELPYEVAPYRPVQMNTPKSVDLPEVNVTAKRGRPAGRLNIPDKVNPAWDVAPGVEPLYDDELEVLQSRIKNPQPKSVDLPELEVTAKRGSNTGRLNIPEYDHRLPRRVEGRNIEPLMENNFLPEVEVTAQRTPARGSKENPYELPELEVTAKRGMGEYAPQRLEQAKYDHNLPKEVERRDIGPVGEAEKKENVEKIGAKQNGQKNGPKTYQELIKNLDAMEEDELDRERRRQRNRAIIAAVGDGVSSIANLAAAGYGAPSAYAPRMTLSKTVQDKYDKYLSQWREDGDKRKAMMVKAKELEDRKNAEKAKLDADAAFKKQQQENWQKTFDANEQYRNNAFKQQQEKLRVDMENAEKNRAQQMAIAKMNNEVQKEANRIREKQVGETAQRKAVNDYLGKPNVFLDNNGSLLTIYDGVWNNNMQQVFDAIENDAKAATTDDNEKRRIERQFKNYDTWQKKMDYVKQNWNKSPSAATLMIELSKTTPQSMMDGYVGGKSNGVMPGVKVEDNNKMPGVK